MDRVVSLYTDLRRFTEAKEAMVSAGGDDKVHLDRKPLETTRSLLTRHAEWARTTKNHRAAASMFIEVGNFAAATELASEHGWIDLYVHLLYLTLILLPYADLFIFAHISIR